MPRISRNDLCSCGSGKKYKKCRLEATKTKDGPTPHSAHDLDRKLSLKLQDFALRTRGEDWLLNAYDVYVSDFEIAADREAESQWSMPYLLYHYEGPDGEEPTVLEEFLEQRARYLSQDELALLQAHQQALVSLWEVEAVHPGKGIQLRDLLMGTERFVHELGLAEQKFQHLVLLARVLKLKDACILIGVNPVPLQPLVADQVRQEYLRRHPGPNPVKLRRGWPLLELTFLWRDAAEAQQKPPELRNTDGDSMVFVRDRLTFPAELRGQIVAALESIEDGEIEPGTEPLTGRFYRAGFQGQEQGKTVLATFRVGPDSLTLETNSQKRADAFRQRLLELHPGLKKDRRTRKTMEEAMREDRGKPSVPRPESYPPEVQQALQAKLLELREEHMRKWLDSPIPALDQQTPRQATKNPAMRERLRALVKQMDYHEGRRPVDQRIDLQPYWDQLGFSQPARAGS